MGEKAFGGVNARSDGSISRGEKAATLVTSVLRALMMSSTDCYPKGRSLMGLEGWRR